MADHVYKIVIDFNGAQGGESTDVGTTPQMPTKLPDAQTQTQPQQTGAIASLMQKGMSSFASLATVATVVSVAKSIFSHEVQRIGRYTGSQQAQSLANATLSLVGKFANPVSSIVNYLYEVEQTNYEMKWENIDLQLYRERAGTPINRSRTNR